MRQNQTVEYVRRMYSKFCWFEPDGKSIDRKPHEMMEIWQAFEALGDYVDSSDPDSEFPNIEHAFQTAEGIRAAGYPEWMQLIGLVHDIGKMMFKYGKPEEGMEGTATGCQWALGGDTWVVGCKLPDGACFPEFNELNPDMSHPRYNTAMGIYKPAGHGNAHVRVRTRRVRLPGHQAPPRAAHCQRPPEGRSHPRRGAGDATLPFLLPMA